MLDRIIKNNKGVGMVDALVAMLVLGVAITAMINISGELFNWEKTYNEEPLLGFSNAGNSATSIGKMQNKVSQIAISIKDSMLKSQHPVNRNIFNQGLCAYVDVPSQVNGPGIINLSVFKEDDTSALADMWKNQNNHVHISDSEHDDCNEDDNYNFCLAYDIHDPVLNDTEQLMKDSDYLVLVSVIPQQIESTPQGIIVSDIDTTSDLTMNIKNISYKMVLEIKATIDGVRTSEVITSTAWAGDLGVCTIAGKRVLPLADGYGDKDGNAIYNIVSYDGTTTQGQNLDGVFEELHVQEGIVVATVDTGVQLQSKLTGSPSSSLPTSMNCAETEFKCRDSNSNTRNYGPSLLAFSLDLSPSIGQVLVPVEGNPVLEVSNGGANVASGSSFAYKFNGEEYSESGGNIIHSNSGRQMTFAGSDKLDMRISDMPLGDSTNNMCRAICSSSNSYNQVPSASQYKGRLRIKPLGVGGDLLNLQDPKGVSCTACYMKNCSRFGLATFGSMNNMPNEPLDSGLPECAVKAPSTSANIEYSAILPPNSCLKASWSGTDLIYSAESCLTELPVLCYNFGKYLLAQDLLVGASKTLANRNFENASQRCYEMGREIIDSGELGNLLGQQGINMLTTLPYSSLTSTTYGTTPVPVFEIMNLAKQGMYLSPETSTEKSDSSIWFAENSISPSNSFWTNLKTDSAGNIYAPIPFMHIPASPTFNDTIAAYYSEDPADKGSFVMKDLSSNILSHTSGTNDRGILLFNNIRYKGALSVKNNSPFGSSTFRYLCRKKTAPFLYFASSDKGSTQAGGIAVCSNEGGYFVPPITPHDWVRAMFMAKANHNKYPFPDPATGVSDITMIDPIWVAYQGHGRSNPDWVAFPFTELNQIINMAGATLEKVDSDGIVSGGGKDGIVCIESKGIDGLKYKAGAAATTCDGSEVRLKKNDLFGSNNLVNRLTWLFSKTSFPTGKVLEI